MSPTAGDRPPPDHQPPGGMSPSPPQATPPREEDISPYLTREYEDYLDLKENIERTRRPGPVKRFLRRVFGRLGSLLGARQRPGESTPAANSPNVQGPQRAAQEEARRKAAG
jgi:hypothetical protein